MGSTKTAFYYPWQKMRTKRSGSQIRKFYLTLHDVLTHKTEEYQDRVKHSVLSEGSEGGWAGGRNCLLFMKIMRINFTNVSIVVALLVVSYVFFRLAQRSQLVTADTESVRQTSGTHNFFTCMVHHSLFIFVRRRQLRFRSIILKKNNLANIAAYLISCMGNNAYICIRLKFNT